MTFIKNRPSWGTKEHLPYIRIVWVIEIEGFSLPFAVKRDNTDNGGKGLNDTEVFDLSPTVDSVVNMFVTSPQLMLVAALLLSCL